MRRFTTILNYLGLTLAFAAFIVVAVQVKWDATFNHAFPDHERIYRLEGDVGAGEFWCSVCRPVIRETEGLEGVESVATLSWEGNLNWTTTDDPDAPRIALMTNSVDRACFDVLGLEILEGDLADFDSIKSSLVISDKAAELLFPCESAVGKRLYSDSDWGNAAMTVKAVFRSMPDNCWPRHDVYGNLGGTADDWGEWSFTCLMKLAPDACPDSVCWRLARKIEAMGGQLTAESDSHCPFQLSRLDRIHFENKAISDPTPKANFSMLITLSSAALVILIIALINFFNISMAGIPAMIRSINTRKVLGAMREELIGEQLLRTLLIALAALASAVGIVYWLSGTSFASYISGSLNPKDHIGLIAGVAAIAVIVSLLSGIYPAFYSTSLQPAMTLKGGFAHSVKGKMLRNVLVGVQLTISLVLIAFAVFIKVQTDFMRSHDMGFRSAQVFYTRLPDVPAEKRETLTENLKKRPEIEDVTYANARIVSRDGIMMTWGRLFEETKINYVCLPVSINFCNFFGIKMEEGRDFRESDLQDERGCYIFNRVAADRWDMKAGDKLGGHNGETSIVGVMHNFNCKSLQYAVEPMALYCFGSTPWRPLYHCYFRTARGVTLEQATAILLEECQRLDATVKADDVAVEYLDESLGQLYEREGRLASLIFIACVLSVLISIIGILGLIHYETQFRRREIGIRRVMGASICEILAMLNATYIRTLALCFVVAVPVALFIIRRWLEDYAYQSPVPVWIFLAALAIVLVIIVLSVTLKSLRTALANPVESIKTE